MNFSDVDCGTVEFLNAWKAGKEVCEIEIQTDDYEVFEQECQAVIWECKEVQTEMGGEHQEYSAEALANKPPTVAIHLMQFLSRVGPLVEQALQENIEEDLYEGYRVLEEDGSDDINYRYTLSCDFGPAFVSAGISDAREHRLNCTGLGWTATGSSVVASFGRHDITGWCELPGLVCAWNIFKRDFKESRPDFVYEHSSCIMCLSCHPARPALIAAGSFNGEVLVLDLGSEDQLVAVTSINDYFHREPIAQVAWVFDMAEGDYQVASVSGDGNALFWSLSTKLEYPTNGIRLERVHTKGRKKEKTLGGTSLSFSVDGKLSSSVILGTEGGSISRFFLQRRNDRADHMETELKWTKDAEAILMKVPKEDRIVFKNKVEKFCKDNHKREVTPSVVYDSKPEPSLIFPSRKDFSYLAREGPVYHLDCSPFHRNLFLSCGADGLLCIFNMLQSEPVIEVEPDSSYVFCAKWSKTRPQVLAAACGSGRLYIYDLGQSTNAPSAELEPPPLPDAAFRKNPIYAVAFNPKQRDFLAAGDSSGRVHIWQLSWKLGNLQKGEAEALKEMFSESFSTNTQDEVKRAQP